MCFDGSLKYSPASLKPRKMFFTYFSRVLLARPGNAFCSVQVAQLLFHMSCYQYREAYIPSGADYNIRIKPLYYLLGFHDTPGYADPCLYYFFWVYPVKPAGIDQFHGIAALWDHIFSMPSLHPIYNICVSWSISLNLSAMARAG